MIKKLINRSSLLNDIERFIKRNVNLPIQMNGMHFGYTILYTINQLPTSRIIYVLFNSYCLGIDWSCSHAILLAQNGSGNVWELDQEH